MKDFYSEMFEMWLNEINDTRMKSTGWNIEKIKNMSWHKNKPPDINPINLRVKNIGGA